MDEKGEKCDSGATQHERNILLLLVLRSAVVTVVIAMLPLADG